MLQILQSIENRQTPVAGSYGFSTLDEIFSRKTSAVVQPMPVHPVTTTPEKENMSLKPNNFSPVLPGTGSVTHNITRMLGDSSQQPKSQLPSTATRAPHFSPYSTSHFLSFRHKILQEKKASSREGKHPLTFKQFRCTSYILLHRTLDFIKHFIFPFVFIFCFLPSFTLYIPAGFVITCTYFTDENIDVENDSQDHLKSDSSNITDMSISTQGSTSPQSVGAGSSPSGSTKSSPGSNTDAVTSPENSEEQPKKKARTNYTNEQVQALLKIFHENPYPDSEMMENIGKDLGIPENKIKVTYFLHSILICTPHARIPHGYAIETQYAGSASS